MKTSVLLSATIHFVFILSSCKATSGAQTGEVDAGVVSYKKQIISVKELGDLKAAYLKFQMPTGGNKVLPKELWPDNFLGRLHTWFSIGHGLQPATTQSKGLKIQLLRTIPNDVIKDLARVLQPKEQRVSWSVLGIEFWQQVQDAQNSGIKVGFLSPDNLNSYGGIFINDKKMIAIDALVEPGSLPHEMRHYLQYNTISNTDSRPLRTLTSECVNSVAAALGEIDSTTIELRTYVGLSKDFIFSAEELRSLAIDNYVRPPQEMLFRINLEYPANASQWVKKAYGCPPEIYDLMESIYARSMDSLHRIEGQLFLMSMNNDSAVQLISENRQNGCEVTGNLDEKKGTTNTMCVKNEQDLKALLLQMPELQESYEDQLAQEIIARPIFLKSILNKLTAATKLDLCNHSGGFVLLSGCQN